jgi:hypothetical protein
MLEISIYALTNLCMAQDKHSRPVLLFLRTAEPKSQRNTVVDNLNTLVLVIFTKVYERDTSS